MPLIPFVGFVVVLLAIPILLAATGYIYGILASDIEEEKEEIEVKIEEK